MGRRELLIAAAFALAGIVAYLLTAGPAGGDRSNRSLPALVERWREAGRQTAARGSIRHIGTAALTAEVSELRVSGFAELQIEAEDRRDVTWTLDAEATGPTTEAARATAGSVTVAADNLGDALSLTPNVPNGARATLALTLRVPARLAVRLENGRRVDVSGVASARLESLVGDVSLRAISGTITGTHRNGSLTISGAGGATLTLNNVRAVLSDLRGETAVTIRNGDCQISRPAGAVSIDGTNASMTVAQPAGPVRVNATGGAVRVTAPRDTVHVDARRAPVAIDADAPVSMSLMGVDASVTVSWSGTLPVALDLSSTDGTITAADFGLTAERRDNVTRLVHESESRDRVTVRTTRSPIVIAQRK